MVHLHLSEFLASYFWLGEDVFGFPRLARLGTASPSLVFHYLLFCPGLGEEHETFAEQC